MGIGVLQTTDRYFLVKVYTNAQDFEDGLNAMMADDYKLRSWTNQYNFVAIFVKRNSLADRAY
jgi:hypothetical protein